MKKFLIALLICVFTSTLASPGNIKTTYSKQIDCIAEAIYFEARGEPFEGKLAVAKTIINRAAHPLFPKTYCDVVYQKHQYSWTSIKNRKVIKADLVSAQIAYMAMFYNSPVLFFHNQTVKPYWAPKLEKVAKIGHHTFYTFKNEKVKSKS